MKNLALIICTYVLLTACGKRPEANFKWSPEKPKAGEQVEFTNLSKDAKKYSWNLGNMSISSETNPVTTYQQAGDYIIDLTASSGIKSDTKTVTITVIP
jgi:PKD repeat protein